MAAVLTSWKEIAIHLGKSVRTVQRWEKELGLPVRRPDMRRSGIVLADPDELDSWIHAQSPATLAMGNGPSQNGVPADPENTAVAAAASDRVFRGIHASHLRLLHLQRRTDSVQARTRVLYDEMGLKISRLRQAVAAHQRATTALRQVVKRKGQPVA